jgi:hypothetical protein
MTPTGYVALGHNRSIAQEDKARTHERNACGIGPKAVCNRNDEEIGQAVALLDP